MREAWFQQCRFAHEIQGLPEDPGWQIVRDIKKAFPDSEFSDLAQALYDALRNGS